MIGNKNVIGLCAAKVQSVALTEYLSRLHVKALEAGFKLMVFNSPVEPTRDEKKNTSAAAIFDIINFDVVDVLVIFATCFEQSDITERLISRAKAAGRPYIVLKDDRYDCCITDDYVDGLKEVIDHVINVHGVTDTFFMAGRRENDPQSEIRIACYKEVLEKNGLNFSDELVEYGEYWNVPAAKALERILAKREKPPRAIFCANDFMAITVCEELEKLGWRVPEDVIVTGFDGIPEAWYFIPRITTCGEDFEECAAVTVKTARALLNGEEVPKNRGVKFKPRYCTSCGCSESDEVMNKTSLKLFRDTHTSLAHEEFVYAWIDNTMKLEDMNTFIASLPYLLVERSYLCLNRDIITQVMETEKENETEKKAAFTDSLDIVNSHFCEGCKKKQFELRDIIADPERWVDEEYDYIFTVIYSGGFVYGYYAAKTNDIVAESHQINRSSRALNIAFNTVAGYYRQRMMMLGLRNAAFTDSLTGLPNLKGITKWYREFSDIPENHEKCITVSVYALPQYKYIYETYGIEEIEEIICIVAEALRLTNTKDCCVGHTADDEFLVINYFDSKEMIAPAINAATSKFYGIMDDFNNRGSKDYHLDVNAGCSEIYPGWEGKLASFYKLASNEMYLNQLNSSRWQTVKKVKLPEEYYKSLELLIEKNLFGYHFQPIVDVKTGEICAYEALMRPDRSIGLNPGEVIMTAQEYGRLYDIEKATMFNVMKAFSDSPDSFMGRKIFINSIPGYFLKGEDYSSFMSRYSGYFGSIVIEITENSTVSDNELGAIKEFLNGRAPIAIDDYGTGHSNIVNLLRYSPQIIKIDRYLITEIQKDSNKQMFFRSTVEFARMNDIKVLAEGVETGEELKCVTRLGADLIQGYYTGKPAPVPLDKISDEIKKELSEALAESEEKT